MNNEQIQPPPLPSCGEDEELTQQCIQIVRDEQQASVSLLQRRLRLGYTRAARIMDELERRGIVSAHQPGTGIRTVLLVQTDPKQCKCATYPECESLAVNPIRYRYWCEKCFVRGPMEKSKEAALLAWKRNNPESCGHAMPATAAAPATGMRAKAERILAEHHTKMEPLFCVCSVCDALKQILAADAPASPDLVTAAEAVLELHGQGVFMFDECDREDVKKAVEGLADSLRAALRQTPRLSPDLRLADLEPFTPTKEQAHSMDVAMRNSPGLVAAAEAVCKQGQLRLLSADGRQSLSNDILRLAESLQQSPRPASQATEGHGEIISKPGAVLEVRRVPMTDEQKQRISHALKGENKI